jgi:NDP-sugar pyrophosphorylase family protein
MIGMERYLKDFHGLFIGEPVREPWDFISKLPEIILGMIAKLPAEYIIHGDVAIHQTAVIDATAIIRGPAIIAEDALIGCFALLRGGTFVGKNSIIGAHGEFKTSVIMHNSVCGHFNFVGESMIGSNVNLEAGAVLANHYNELKDKPVRVKNGNDWIDTGCVKFGSVIGDGSRIGANAVLFPGILLPPDTVINRLQLVESW